MLGQSVAPGAPSAVLTAAEAAAKATPKASLEANPGIVLLPSNAAPWRLPRWRHGPEDTPASMKIAVCLLIGSIQLEPLALVPVPNHGSLSNERIGDPVMIKRGESGSTGVPRILSNDD